ncbi:major facilitator superfamily transporter [Pseudomonas saudimassiliensis]|uniref:Major facilitator superfamily transporter n=1 Tax=Pseudomonas saudimassiliensis TaxID=1461581 RepID=A0A078MDA2_9PSED|nr:MFS transporter [Pseudomonas saudimassiliensis]CEA04255.1 major facilitator superfamily transporter [Pseudomonas saudimassiliensis]CEF26496.1 major facilitator superfamily transporter [Pseudomonas saudimassiliensis]
MRWSTYWIVTVAVVVVGLAMGVTLPLVSLRLDQWGYDAFAIGVMAAMPAIGILLGARLAGRLAGYLGSERCMRLMLISAAISVGLLTVLANYWVWLVLRLVLGGCLTITFIIGESWINQLIEDRLRGRLVAVYGSAFALSQLCGPLLLGALGTTTDAGFWLSIVLLLLGTVVLWPADGAPQVDGANASGRGVMKFVRRMPAVAWAVMLFACFEAMALTLLPVYLIREGFAQGLALLMVSTVVVGDAVLQLPIGWLADRMQRTTLYRVCGALLLGSSLSIPLLLHTPLIWPALVLFGAGAGGLYTLSLILVGQRFRDDALVRANAHIALLWGAGCLIGPLSTGAASHWLSSHALPWWMAGMAAIFLLLALRRGAFDAVVVSRPAREPGAV